MLSPSEREKLPLTGPKPPLTLKAFSVVRDRRATALAPTPAMSPSPGTTKSSAPWRELLIRSPRLAILPPEVILLKTYEGEGGRAVVFSRKNLFKRDRYTCQYCGIQPGPEELTVDHVVPRSRGGTSTWENCVLACVECNKRKADRTPAQAGLKMRKTPRKPSWKALVQVPARDRRESWDKVLSRAYWEIELEP